jgi:hypothetical protein
MINKHLEILEYRKFKVSDNEAEVEIPILTLKTGTVLFRGVLDPSKFISDFLGIPIEGKPNAYCLPSQYNTFFFSYPYVFDTNYYNKLDAKGKNSHTSLYVLTNDVKVALMIKPSKIMCYVLIGYWSTPEEDLIRVEKLRELKIDSFVMPYDKTNEYQKKFSRTTWTANAYLIFILHRIYFIFFFYLCVMHNFVYILLSTLFVFVQSDFRHE